MITHLLPLPVVTFGRESQRNVCLRVEPTSMPENAESTRQISKSHFVLRYLGNRVEVMDAGSSNGTSLRSLGPLSAEVPVAIGDHEQINVAGVLTLDVELVRRRTPQPLDEKTLASITERVNEGNWLAHQLVGPEKPGEIEFIRIGRGNNLPEREYVLLFGMGGIGPTTDALIRVGEPASAKSRSRGLDIGGTSAVCPASLFFDKGLLFLTCSGQERVVLGDRKLGENETCQLRPANVITILGEKISIATAE